jgi:cellulose synthase/poly-beta-1,6-N-acetylglucosamine synthase-like glycosyltransferase
VADLSIIIPAHKEPHLQRTIDGLHENSRESVDVIVCLDDYWPDEPLTGCTWIHASSEIGMRTAINMAVSQSRCKYIMKCDGHCLFRKDFDVILKRDCQPDWVLVPVLYKLDVDTWKRCGHRREFFYIRKHDFRGKDWPEFTERCEGERLCDLMTFQGSCWFMEKAWFEAIGGEDDINYSGSGREAQEISIKTWLGGGRCVLDRNVWYAHWQKPSPARQTDRSKSMKYVMETYKDKMTCLMDRFTPVPSWD